MKARHTPTLLFAALFAAACSPLATDVDAVRRGDESFARGNYDEALAEYRLAIRQGVDDPAVAARVAHTYTLLGRVDDAGDYYLDAAARDSSLADQAVSDLMWLARGRQEADDRFSMARAVETALQIRPGIGVGNMSLPLARHYFASGEYGRALPFYQKAMVSASEEAGPEIVFEIGVAYDEIGDCRNALTYFEQFRSAVRPWERGEVDWYIGTCAFNLARRLRESVSGVDPTQAAGQIEQALQLVERTIFVTEPHNIQAAAWFEKGEILVDLRRCDEAMDAYSQVRFADQAGALIERAQDRFDEIRFGRDLEHLRDGRCR